VVVLENKYSRSLPGPPVELLEDMTITVEYFNLPGMLAARHLFCADQPIPPVFCGLVVFEVGPRAPTAVLQ